jgi:hypothetical protein
MRQSQAKSFVIFATGFTLAFFSLSCTKTGRKSGVKDLQGGPPPLERLQIKYSFAFIGASGKTYPIYMNGILEVNEGQKEAVWNSAIDSDGGLVSATNESKTLKPDKNVILKNTPAPAEQPAADPSTLVFVSGNPELGRGMSLSVQKVIASGVPTWKAVGLKYFGYEAQIEDSVLIGQLPPSAVRP